MPNLSSQLRKPILLPKENRQVFAQEGGAAASSVLRRRNSSAHWKGRGKREDRFLRMVRRIEELFAEGETLGTSMKEGGGGSGRGEGREKKFLSLSKEGSESNFTT